MTPRAPLRRRKALHAKANRPNLFIKIPGTIEGLPAIEEAIFAGVPVNVTLLFSRDHYVRGGGRLHARPGASRRRRTEPRRAFGRLGVRQPLGQGDAGEGAGESGDRLGIAVSQQSYKAYRDLLDSDRWQWLEGLGARPQRLLFASTSNKDPQASDVLYMGALAAPNTVNTVPEETLLAFANHGQVDQPMRAGRRRLRSRCWRASPVPASMSRRWPGSCKTRAPRASSTPGKICSARSRRKSKALS